MNIFNIGKANERITALESELATTKAELATCKENSAAIEKAAESIKIERDTLSGKIAEETKVHEALKQSVASKDKELTDLKAAQSDFDAKVDKAASAKALQITASQGAPIIPAKPGDVTVDPAKQKISELRGLDKVQACIAAELAAAAPNKR